MSKQNKSKNSSEKKSSKGSKAPLEKLSVKELQERVLSEIKRFISMGKSRGYLTYEEVNDLLPPEISSPELLDILMEALDQNDVKLVDGTKKGKGKDSEEFLKEPTEAAAEEEEEEEEEEDEGGKGNDPV